MVGDRTGLSNFNLTRTLQSSNTCFLIGYNILFKQHFFASSFFLGFWLQVQPQPQKSGDGEICYVLISSTPGVMLQIFEERTKVARKSKTLIKTWINLVRHHLIHRPPRELCNEKRILVIKEYLLLNWASRDCSNVICCLYLFPSSSGTLEIKSSIWISVGFH